MLQQRPHTIYVFFNLDGSRRHHRHLRRHNLCQELAAGFPLPVKVVPHFSYTYHPRLAVKLYYFNINAASACPIVALIGCGVYYKSGDTQCCQCAAGANYVAIINHYFFY
jgi:hypothetical protein